MAGILRTDTIQNSNTSTIITQTNSTTITIGTTGQTVALASGATSSGFGATYNGAVNWDTTPKTTGFTAVSGVGYFCNTTSAAFTVTLPATPTAGNIVAIADYNGTAATNIITVGRNSSNINGSATNLIISKNYASIIFVYVDSTTGWRSITTSNTANVINDFIAATGGTILTCGDYKSHVFTGPGTFTVTNTGSLSNSVEYLVVAGGGGSGGGNGGGGGGAGGYRQNYPSPTTAGLPVTVTSYPITVGGGGTAGPSSCSTGSSGSGNSSIFSTITSAGGGGGGRAAGAAGSTAGTCGGSGGGGGGRGSKSGGTGNTPPVSPSQGSNGGTSAPGDAGGTSRGAGGGGLSAVGGNSDTSQGANGGAGGSIADAFFGPTSPSYGTPGPASGRYFAGGGGGGGNTPAPSSGSGGAGGGGPGSKVGSTTPGANVGVAGTVNTGGGAGGGSYNCSAGAVGGSGIVVIRYKFQ